MREDVFQVFLQSPPPSDEPSSMRSLSVRMPADTYRYLTVMADHANLSLNAMAVQLLSWGIDFALWELPPEIHADIVSDVEGDEAASEVLLGRL
jgi:hypothetical protein